MATVEQIQALLDKQAEKIGKDVENKVTEKMADNLVKKVVENLKPVLMNHIEDQVAKAVDPVIKMHKKTDSLVSKLVNDLAHLTSKVDSQEDEMKKRHDEDEKKKKDESEIKKKKEEDERRKRKDEDETRKRKEEDEMRKRQEDGGMRKRDDGAESKVKELFKEVNSTLTFSPITEEDWKALSDKLRSEQTPKYQFHPRDKSVIEP